jgi:hypothetical protein
MSSISLLSAVLTVIMIIVIVKFILFFVSAGIQSPTVLLYGDDDCKSNEKTNEEIKNTKRKRNHNRKTVRFDSQNAIHNISKETILEKIDDS